MKVQDGCDYKCTYCTIPLARGISRSDTVENVVKNAKEIAEKDIKEIVLTGVNIGDYGKGEFGNKKHEHTFLDLVKELNKVEELKELEFLLSNQFTERRNHRFGGRKQEFCTAFSIFRCKVEAMICSKMKRRYLTKLYSDRVSKIREVMPDAAIGVDVIVGFPEKPKRNFRNLQLYQRTADYVFTRFHVF